MAVGDDDKAAWTAAVANAVAIPDAGGRDAHASALQEQLNQIPSADRWTDSRSPFFGFRTGWEAWTTLYGELRDARSQSLVQTGVASPQALVQPSPVFAGVKAIPGAVKDTAKEDIQAIADSPIGQIPKKIADGANSAADAIKDFGYFVPLAVLGVLLLVVYRRAS